MKNKKINLFILTIAFLLVLYFALKDNFKDVLKQLSKVNLWIFVFAILIYVTSLAFKSLSLHMFIKNHKKDYPWKKTYELTLIGQFLNGITPFQSGGQPFQVYLLKKQGIRISDSTSAMIKDFISFQIALILMGVVALVSNKLFGVMAKQSYLNWLIGLGFIINVIVLLFLFLITSTKKTSLKIINKLLDAVFRLKIVKKTSITKERIMSGLSNFYESGIELRKDKLKLFLAITYNVINLVLLYLIPFIIFKSIGCDSVTPFASVVVTAFIMLIGNFIPIPGATGGIEYSFICFFGSFISSKSILSSAMLLWRFVTYFLGMVIGYMVLVFKREVNKK